MPCERCYGTSTDRADRQARQTLGSDAFGGVHGPEPVLVIPEDL